MNRSNSLISKFEEFFSREYKEELFSILERYPDERTLSIDYEKLEIFDPSISDLLIDKPEEVINAAQQSIKNIDPLVKDANIFIHFNNLTNVIPFSELTNEHIGKFVVIKECSICGIKKPSPRLDVAVFECRGCLRLHKVEQASGDTIIEPSLCSECGGRSFRLLQEDSKFTDSQVIQVTDENTSRTLTVILEGANCSYDEYMMYNKLQITGVLRTFRNTSNGDFDYYFKANNIVKLPDSSLFGEGFIEDTRNSPEYREWVKSVIDRDKVCQCCGGEKHLEAHHIFGYKNHPDYRVNPDNGIALCKWCHGKYHSYYGLANANAQSLIRFIRRFGKY